MKKPELREDGDPLTGFAWGLALSLLMWVILAAGAAAVYRFVL